MKLKLVSTILLYCLLIINGNAQGVVELLCRIVDADTKIPVSYATIQFADSNNGMIANIDGDFRIPFVYKQQKKSIVISSIGFETLTVALGGLNNKTINIIALKPRIEALDAVVVNASKKPKTKENISPYTIVKTAIAKIPQNYPMDNYSKIGYYRDYQIVKNSYYNLNEAIVESFDSGFDTDIMLNSENPNALFSYKENNDFVRDSLLLIPYDGDKKYINNVELSGQGGNELGILNIHNPIRNFEQLSFSFVYVFKMKFLDNHDLFNLKKVYLNDEVLYEISFKAKDRYTKASHKASGKIYISKTDFAIHKFTYALHEIKTLDPLFEVNIEYKRKNELMYLNYITFNNQFVIGSDFKFDIVNVDFDLNEESFYVVFNREVDSTTLDRKDFRFRFNRTKLLVGNVALVDSVTVKVKLANFNLPEIDSDTDMSQFEYKVKNISDITNRKLYDSPKIKGFQFREFFVQEIFEHKEIPRDLIFIDEYRPLSEAKVNQLLTSESYWLNSPLKGSKK